MTRISCPSESWDLYCESQYGVCEVCQKNDRVCECPECPVCHSIGERDCYGKHVAALPARYEYTVRWDNRIDCGTLGTYDTKEDAENAGKDWLMEMTAIDPNPQQAEESYSFEVLDPVEVAPTKEDIKKAALHHLQSTIRNVAR